MEHVLTYDHIERNDGGRFSAHHPERHMNPHTRRPMLRVQALDVLYIVTIYQLPPPQLGVSCSAPKHVGHASHGCTRGASS